MSSFGGAIAARHNTIEYDGLKVIGLGVTRDAWDDIVVNLGNRNAQPVVFEIFDSSMPHHGSHAEYTYDALQKVFSLGLPKSLRS